MFGAAILGAFGSGTFSSINDAVSSMVNLESEFEPNESTKTMYGEANAIYRGMYEAIAKDGQYNALSDFSSRYI